MLKQSITLLIFIFSLQQLYAEGLTISVTGGYEGAKPIAIVPFHSAVELSEDISQIIFNDLKRSGRFKLLTSNQFPAQPAEGRDIQFLQWRAINVEYLVIGRIRINGPGGYMIHFELFDVIKGTLIKGYQLSATEHQLRRAAHKASDLIFQALEKIRGDFSSRIAYITTHRLLDSRQRITLNIADADGYHPQAVVSGRQPIMSPTWSPDGKKIAYVSFENKHPAIFIQDLRTQRRYRMTAFKGINGAPAWSPDGRKMAMTLSKDGNSEIYVMNLVNKKLTRLTYHRAIDTEASWSPDGKSLIFTSDRGGKPQIYQISAQGGKAHRITWTGEYNARARFSPNGKKIVMVTRQKGRYKIAIQDLKTGQVQILTQGGLDESPSFSPNGSMVIYAGQRRGKGVLSMVSVDGLVKQRLATQTGNVREPVWSPYRRN